MKSDNASPANSEQDIVVGYRSRTLLVYGKVVSAIGWVVTAIGIFITSAGISELSAGIIREYTLLQLILTAASFLGMLIGIGMILFGQSISCFVSIEKNTRYTYELLKQK